MAMLIKSFIFLLADVAKIICKYDGARSLKKGK